jgi:hypothetical protein
MAVTMPKTSANHPGVEYVHKDDHRDGTAYKSQWVIPKSDELSVFWDSQTQQWVEGDNAWGLWTLDAAVLKVGEAAAARCPLFVAKFVSEPTGGVALWHGYPADHQRRTSDRPGRSVAHAWLMQGFANLSQAKIAKLLQGKRCVL